MLDLYVTSPMCPLVRSSVRPSVRLCPSVYPLLSPSVCLFPAPSICSAVSLSARVRLSARIAYPLVRTTVALSVRPSVSLSVGPSVRLSVRRSVRPAVCPSIRSPVDRCTPSESEQTPDAGIYNRDFISLNSASFVDGQITPTDSGGRLQTDEVMQLMAVNSFTLK